jgi:hypothetical protein
METKQKPSKQNPHYRQQLLNDLKEKGRFAEMKKVEEFYRKVNKRRK